MVVDHGNYITILLEQPSVCKMVWARLGVLTTKVFFFKLCGMLCQACSAETLSRFDFVSQDSKLF